MHDWATASSKLHRAASVPLLHSAKFVGVGANILAPPHRVARGLHATLANACAR